MTGLREPLRIEAVSAGIVHGLIRGVTGLQARILRLYDVDTCAGAGILGPESKCLWTHDGYRITLMLSEGRLVGWVSQEPDPYLIAKELAAAV